MKTIVFLMATAFISTQAFALDLGDFVGKYTVGKCNGEAKTAYIRKALDKKKNVIGLDVKFYGDEAELLTLLVGRQVTPNPNFKYGNPIKTTITQGMLSEDSFTVATNYVYADDSEELAQVIILRKTASGVVVESSGEENGSCELIAVKK